MSLEKPLQGHLYEKKKKYVEMKMNQLTQGITILVTVISTEKPSIKYSAISKPSVMTHPINYFALMPTYVEISQLSGKDLSTILHDCKSFDY